MPVYDVSNGRVIGRVRRLVIDPDARKIVGLLLAARIGRQTRCLPFRDIHAIGEHAITVQDPAAIVPLSELPDMEEIARTKRRIHHSPILTEDGYFVGDVDEFTINAQTGRIETLLVSGGMIHDLFKGQASLPAHLVLTVGEDATIVRQQAVAVLRQKQTGADASPAGEDDTSSDADDARSASENGPIRSFSRNLLGRFARHKTDDGQEPPVVIIDARDSEASDSTVVSKLGKQARLQQHRAQDRDDVLPPVPLDRGEGGDGEL